MITALPVKYTRDDTEARNRTSVSFVPKDSQHLLRPNFTREGTPEKDRTRAVLVVDDFQITATYAGMSPYAHQGFKALEVKFQEFLDLPSLGG